MKNKRVSSKDLSDFFLELQTLKLSSTTCFCHTVESIQSGDTVTFTCSSKNHILKVSLYLS